MTAEVFGADRMLFGSDYAPGADVGRAIKKINEAKLSGRERNQILVGNGAKLLAAKGLKV